MPLANSFLSDRVRILFSSLHGDLPRSSRGHTHRNTTSSEGPNSRPDRSPLQASGLTGADMRDRLDLHFEGRVCQRRHLDESGGRKVAGEEFASRLPHLFALGDVGDENRHLDNICHAAAGRREEMADLGEDHLGLGVFVAFGACGGHAGDIGDPVHHQAVRPGAGLRLRHLGADCTDNLAHRYAPTCCLSLATRSRIGKTSSALAGGTGKLTRTTPRSRKRFSISGSSGAPPNVTGSDCGSRPASLAISRKRGRYSSGLPLLAFGYQPSP